MLRTRIPRGRGVHRFKFDPLTSGEIETLQSVPSSAATHLAQCSCSAGESHAGNSRAVLAEIADLLLIALQHGHELTIQPNSDNYALDIGIGTSALGAEEALGAQEIMTLESAPYSAAGAHASRCVACRCAAPLPIEPVTTLAAIALNHGHAVQLQPATESLQVTIASERHQAFDRSSDSVRLDTSAVELSMRRAR